VDYLKRHFEHLLWLSWLVFAFFVSVLLSWLLPNFTIRFWCSSLWMSVRFVACLTRYSRGAENMCGGKYNTGFIAIFLRCITAKNYANQPRFDKVIAKIKRVRFFWNTVYSHSLLSHTSVTCMICRPLPTDGGRRKRHSMGRQWYLHAVFTRSSTSMRVPDRQTDRQTDRRTDRQIIEILETALA